MQKSLIPALLDELRDEHRHRTARMLQLELACKLQHRLMNRPILGLQHDELRRVESGVARRYGHIAFPLRLKRPIVIVIRSAQLCKVYTEHTG